MVAKVMPSADIATVQDEDASYYGQKYWFEHQQSDLQQPTILSRARTDLGERVLYWTNTLLHYKTPPVKLLELGSGHGGFVAMLRMLGYDAIGSELSPSIVDLARQIFDVPMRVGTVEDQDFEPGTFDVIALMDVLEHLTDPLNTLATCLKLLTPEGILFIQTPAFPVQLSYEEMVESQHPFLRMMIPHEHLHLFSKESVTEMLRRLGAEHIAFEEPIFAHYDMFFVVSRQPLQKQASDRVHQFLERSANGRLIQAMLDLNERAKGLSTAYHQADHDRTERQKQLETLNDLLLKSEADRADRLALLTNAAQNLEQLQKNYAEIVDRPDAKRLEYDNNRLLRQIAATRLPLNSLANSLQQHNGLPFTNSRNEALEFLRLTQKALSGTEVSATDSTRIVKQATSNTDPELNCIVVDLIPVLPGSENGGAKIFTLQLVKDLVRMLPDCKFVLLTSDITHDELAVLDAPNTTRYCVYRRTQPLDARTTDQLIGMLTRWMKADLLFCPFTLPIFTLASVPIISVIYDLQYLYYPEFFSGREIQEREHNFHHASNMAAYVTCISDYVRQTVLDNSELSPERVRTIHLNASQFVDNLSDNEEILSAHGLIHNEYWLYPANFWQHKNHQVLLTAFGIYRSRHPNSRLKLVCTGTPNERLKDLQHYTKLMQLEDWVIFPGYLSHGQFLTVLKNAYALVFPSLYEGFGMPVLEAMAAGKPVICSNVTSLPEISGDAALLFDPRKPDEIAQAMEQLEQDPELAATLVQHGANRVAAFGNAERTAQQYIDLFREAVSTIDHNAYTAQGIYSDGWLGETLTLTYETNATDHTLQAEFYLPQQTAIPQMNIVITGKDFLETHTFQAGKSAFIEQKLPPYRGAIEIFFYPNFPSSGSADKRSLTCRCSFIRVVLPDQTLELFNAGA